MDAAPGGGDQGRRPAGAGDGGADPVVGALAPARCAALRGFRPERQAKLLDFMEIHFYPLDRGAYEYRNDEEEARNLAYLQSVVGEVARPGKPVVVAEFGWYGGGKPRFDGGKHRFASEEQQARWCRKLVETTAGLPSAG